MTHEEAMQRATKEALGKDADFWNAWQRSGGTTKWLIIQRGMDIYAAFKKYEIKGGEDGDNTRSE